MTSPAERDRGYVIPGFFTNPILRPYLMNVRNWQGYIRFLGLPDRRDNPDIVIDRLFVAPLFARRYVSPDENPKHWIGEAETLLDALAENTSLVLLGDPGIGKSTLLNQIAWMLSRPATNPLIERVDWRLPLPMVLRELPVRGVRNFDDLLKAFLSHEMSAPLREEDGQRYLTQTLAEGNAFLLLDGIDEIGDRRSRENLRKAVLDGINRYPDCQWLLSSRIVGYDEVPFGEDQREQHLSIHEHKGGGVTIRYIAPFDDPRIAAFARNWYAQREAASQRARENADHLVQAIHADDSILRLARVPNLLTMMALIHRIETTLPHGRVLLYERIAEAYLESIDRYRGIDSSPYDLPRKKGWLARVGFEMQRRRESEKDHLRNSEEDRPGNSDILVDSDTVLGWLSEEMNRGDVLRDSPSAQEFLKIIGRRSGLFLPRGEGVYAFVHLSFQEYFAAVALAREVTRLRWVRDEESRLGFSRNTVASWAGESIWRETFTFLFELLASEEEDDWHADLLDCVFGESFSQVGVSKSDEMPPDLGHLLARLIVNSRSGLSDKKIIKAIPHCVEAQFEFQDRTKNMFPTIFSDLVRDDDKLNAKVFEVIGAHINAGKTTMDRSLNLTRSLVSNIDPLANLTALERLYLIGTPVSDIGPLANLTTLKRLCLNDTPVKNIEPLASLTTLKQLVLTGTQISDIEPLANLTALKGLGLNDTPVKNIEPLANLTALETLNLSDTPVENIESLANLTALKFLYLSDTRVRDIGPLANLTTLKHLFLFHTPVSADAIGELRSYRPDLYIHF